jgi:hypothetical protein
MMKITKFISIVFCLMLAQGIAYAQQKPTVQSYPKEAPKSVAFIGNSFFYFNNGIISNLGPMIAEGRKGAPWRQSMITISGSGFDWHDVDSYFRPNAIGKYSFNAQNDVVINPPQKPLFDAAILMDCSQCPIHPQMKSVFTEYAKKHSDTVKRNGSVPVFFMSWAYKDKPDMTIPLADAYTAAGNENGVLVIPVGLAFAKSIASKPDLELYAPDKRHPSAAGTYLSAATTYATLFNQSPVGLKYSAGLSPEVALYLQQVAYDTVKEYQKR